MQSGNFRNAAMLLSFSLVGVVAIVGGCKKHVASVPPAQTISAPTGQPTITLNASPSPVRPCARSNLTWSSTNATDVSIDPSVGRVAVEASTPVTPTESTTYVATANGPGGTTTATARVTVTGGAVAPPTTGQPAGISELFEQNARDAFFDLNKADFRPHARGAQTKS